MDKSIQILKAVVFDWAGTTVDHGSRAPAMVFQEIFRRRGIVITEAEAREPMGRAKRDHIAAITQMPRVASLWQGTFRATCTEDDIDAMYEDFLPLQKSVLADHSQVITGVVDTVRWCRENSLAIGSSTGYTRELMEIVTPLAAEQGYQPDVVLCAEDAAVGRPAPYLLFEAAQRLHVYPMWHIVKVDDTPVGIQAGRNAGCWTIGITRTGNEVGLSEHELNQMLDDEVEQRCAEAAATLTAAGAHYTVNSLSDIVPIVEQIETRLRNGELPFA